MTGATLFSGILCPEVAMEFVDWKFCAEVDPFACAVIKERRPNLANLGDVTAADFVERAKKFGPIDLLVAGSPCQAFSVAGLRKSLDDVRGKLTLRFVEIVNAIDPRFVLWENVPGVFSSHDNPFGCMLAGLVGADAPLVPTEKCGKRWTDSGIAHGPRRTAAWVVRDAQHHGVPQRRRRIFVLAGRAGDRPHPGAVFFIAQSLQGNSAKGQEAGQAVAALTSAGVGTCGADDNQAQAGHLGCEEIAATLKGGSGERGWSCDDGAPLVASTGNVSHCLNAGGMHRIDYETETLVTHSLRGDGVDASEDGTGRGIPLVAPVFNNTGQGWWSENEVCQAARAGNGKSGGESRNSSLLAIPILEAGARTGKSTDDIRAGIGVGKPGDSNVASLRGSSRSYVAAVRRLTPTEVERLQGLPDGWTLVTYRGKLAADGPRYRAVGNGMAVPVVREIGECLRQCIDLVDGKKIEVAA